MRALAGGIPRALKSHRTPEGAAYGAYLRSKVSRLGRLPGDARPWLKSAGLLTLDLDRLAEEAASARAVLTNGSGRRARDKARVALRTLERRTARLRASLESAEKRLEELASSCAGPDIAAALAAMRDEEAAP